MCPLPGAGTKQESGCQWPEPTTGWENGEGEEGLGEIKIRAVRELGREGRAAEKAGDTLIAAGLGLSVPIRASN